MLTLQNQGVRWGALTEPNGLTQWFDSCDALATGHRPRWTMETLDRAGGQTLIWNQCRAYEDAGNRNKRFWHRVAEQLPLGERFKIVLTLPCVPNLSGAQADAAGLGPIEWMMTTDPDNTADVHGRYQIRRQLDMLASIRDAPGSRLDFEVRPMHEHNLNFGRWGYNRDTAANFVALWRWVADECHLRNFEVSWCLSIGPVYGNRNNNPAEPGYNFDHSHGFARWPGAAWVDVLDLDLYNKWEANRDRTVLGQLLDDWILRATQEGIPWGMSEWGSGAPTGVCNPAFTGACPGLGGPPDHGWYLDTWQRMDAAPASGPGSLKYQVYFSPRFGGNVDAGGGDIDGYYDLIRTGAEVFPERHQLTEDTMLWLMGGRTGPAPFDLGAPTGPGATVARIFVGMAVDDPVVEHTGAAVALAVAVETAAQASHPIGDIEMTALTNPAEDLVLNWLLTTGSATRPSGWHVQIHIGTPGEDGTANPAANNGRQPVTFGPASGGTVSNQTAVSWTSVAANETYTHVTVWSASTGGTPLLYGLLTQPRTVTAGDTFTIPAGSLTVTAD